MILKVLVKKGKKRFSKLIKRYKSDFIVSKGISCLFYLSDALLNNEANDYNLRRYDLQQIDNSLIQPIFISSLL